ncbi:GNAT family N-acetyltransferase [Hymenobacter weizhouensis]|uniref:GNAT family N-acetyltransferase n=1 Tax=Hymenobacter sp. YIM 151500-1 TaxID=2987689 RepID=UPI0022279345|nr:GNAT family protein [Hymenobacter sp. YIM 151500-1]UYZ62376.1 GNAT family N-acetyltransferase [Hymenobacter sp. YIM 151500-1]
MDFARNITLENARVRLRPLELTDFDDLKAVAFDEEIWRYLLTPMPRNSVELAAYLAQSLREREAGRRYAFAIIDKESSRVVGSTSYGNIALADGRLEIGWTWLGRDYQRTGINRAAKHLLLKYAFGELGCERVELKADARNWQSREAMRRMGATEEGTLRSHCLLPSGQRRDSVYFSILKSEWDQLRQTVFQQFDARG